MGEIKVIDRDRIRSLAMAIREHADLLEQYAGAPDVTPLLIEKEVLGRVYLIESRLMQLRSAVSLPDDTFRPRAPVPVLTRAEVAKMYRSPTRGARVHVLGDRPTDDEAA